VRADDPYLNGTDTLSVSISSTAGGNFESVSTTGTVSNTVVDDTDAVYAEISVSAASVAEGDSLTYTVTLKDSGGNAVTVPAGSSVAIALSWSGAAAGGTDTGALPTSVTVGGGASSATFVVTTTNDTLVEANEPLVATITGVTDINGSFESIATGSNAIATSTILNNDSFTVADTAGDDDDANENRDADAGNDIVHSGAIGNVSSEVVLSVDDSVASGLTSNGEAITYAWNAGSRTLTASTASGTVFTVTLNATNDGYAFRQIRGIDHPAIADEAHGMNIPLTVLAKDGSGNLITTAGFTVTVNDDAPSVTGDKLIVTPNDGAHAESGYLAEATISNDVTGITWNTASLPSLVFEGKPILYVDHGNGTLTGELSDGTLIFRLTIDPTTVNASNNPQYSFELLNAVGRIGTLGSETTYTVISGGNIDNLDLGFGGYLVDSMTAVDALGAVSTVNTNNNWIGVGGNWFDAGERLFMNFTDPSGNAGQVRGINMIVEGQGSAAYTLSWTVTAAIDDSGNSVTYSGSINGVGNADVPFSIPLSNGALYFTSLEISSPPGGGQFRIGFSGVSANNYFSDIPLDFSYTMTDADNDTATGLVDVTLTAPPIDYTPVARADSVSATEDTVLSGNLAANDALSQDGGNVWALGNQAMHGTAVVNADGTFSYTPNPHFSGTDSFTYTLTDADGDVSTATVTVNVSPVADTPLLSVTATPTSVLFQTSWESAPDSNNSSETVSANPFEGWTRLDAPDPYSGGTNTLEIWSNGDSQQRQDGGSNTIYAAPGNGVDWLELNNASSNVQTIGISRTVATQAGLVYQLSFDYAGRPGFTGDYTNISVQVDGTTVASYSATSPQTYLDWKNLKLSIVGDGASHTISILTTATSFNPNGRGAMIDDIVLIGVQGVAANNAVGGTMTDIQLANYVSASLVDSDGSETLSLSLSGVPAGAQIVAGTNTYTESGGVITIQGSDLATAMLRIDGSYLGNLHISVTATATESATGATATAATQTLDLHVMPQENAIVAADIVDSTGNLITGTSAANTLSGTNNAEVIDGGAGNDTISASGGNDVILGGSGSDTLTGGAGADVFKWVLGDSGTPGTPATDTITDGNAFNSTAGEALDLRDLLQGEVHAGLNAGNLADFLHFERSGSSTRVHISTTGGFSGDAHAPGGTYTSGVEDMTIVLNGVNLVGTNTTDQQIIQDLLNRGKLITD